MNANITVSKPALALKKGAKSVTLMAHAQFFFFLSRFCSLFCNTFWTLVFVLSVFVLVVSFLVPKTLFTKSCAAVPFTACCKASFPFSLAALVTACSTCFFWSSVLAEQSLKLRAQFAGGNIHFQSIVNRTVQRCAP